MDQSALIADIGGTNARFALCGTDGAPRQAATLKCADHEGPAQAAMAYLRETGAPVPSLALFALAAPLDGDEIAMTNHPWRFSREGARQAMNVERLEVLNDFVAVALAAPHLTDKDTRALGGGQAVADAPIALLGPGTGLGTALLLPTPKGPVAVAAEGGHVTMAAANAREAKVLDVLRARFGHVSAERCLSGPGLSNLHQAIAAVDGVPVAPLDPPLVTARALDRACPVCSEALDMFFEMLGTAAGNLALSAGARGGVLLAGGILPRLADALAESRFRARFEDKGRFSAYMRKIPVHLVLHPHPALLGLAARAARMLRKT